jgi:sugar phosphate isomerase/epimerase
VGLEGVLVSVGTAPDRMPLRDAAVRRRYLELGKRYGLAFPSVAAGSILNQIPLRSEPQAAVYVIDAVEAAAALGAKCILVAFFSNGDLRLRDAMGEFRNVSEGPSKEYALDEQGVTRVVEALRQIVPRARDAGVILGLENTLTAGQNLEILDRVGSPMVQVYYDVGNSTAYGYDVPGEIRRLGRDRICQIHIKETLGMEDPNWGLLGGPARGGVDFPGVAAACREIGYDGWYVLETSGRDGRFAEDTRANVEFVKRRFA